METTQSNSGNGTREKLMGEMQNVIHEAESWLKQSGQATSDEFRSAKAKFEATLATAKDDLMAMEHKMVERTKDAAKATDQYVHENPWKAVGLGCAVGVICGMLIARK